MAIREHIEESGRWLFRWRGYLPVAVLLLAMLAVAQETPGSAAGFPELAWESGCLIVSMLGLAIRVATVGQAPVGTSGRNAREQRATSLNTTGVYSLVRHPLYLGNFFLMLGVVAFARSAWLTVWYCLSFWLYYERIMAAEEAFLREKFTLQFEQWSRCVPAFVPRFSGWSPAPLGFSARNCLRREYNGFFAVFVSMFLLDVARNLALERRVQADPRWWALLGIALAVWFLLRSLKRYTELLRVQGR
jgi:protein-S-isoprenylcysteine O-methyltransferase Ste14